MRFWCVAVLVRCGFGAVRFWCGAVRCGAMRCSAAQRGAGAVALHSARSGPHSAEKCCIQLSPPHGLPLRVANLCGTGSGSNLVGTSPPLVRLLVIDALRRMCTDSDADDTGSDAEGGCAALGGAFEGAAGHADEAVCAAGLRLRCYSITAAVTTSPPHHAHTHTTAHAHAPILLSTAGARRCAACHRRDGGDGLGCARVCIGRRQGPARSLRQFEVFTAPQGRRE